MIKYIKWKKGNGTVITGVCIMMLMVAVTIAITNLYIWRTKEYSTQTAADSISDGVAVYMAQNGGDFDDAVDRATELMNRINEESPVNLLKVELDEKEFDENRIKATVYSSDYQETTGEAVNMAIKTSTTEFRKKYSSADSYNGGDFGIEYIRWAIETANDDSHGYSMTSRHGPNYDCSSFVSYALRNSGWYNVPVSSTQSLRSNLVNAGWEVHPFNYSAFQNGTIELQPGDILLFENSGGYGHTEIYLAGDTTIGAHQNGFYDPASGDQSGMEISTYSLSQYNAYNYYLRDPNLQEKIDAAEGG